jgi:hypothetical protein
MTGRSAPRVRSPLRGISGLARPAFSDLDAAGAPHVYLHDADKRTAKLVDRTAAG